MSILPDLTKVVDARNEHRKELTIEIVEQLEGKFIFCVVEKIKDIKRRNKPDDDVSVLLTLMRSDNLNDKENDLVSKLQASISLPSRHWWRLVYHLNEWQTLYSGQQRALFISFYVDKNEIKIREMTQAIKLGRV